MRVLHVTECYEAGTGHVINTISAITPEFDHHLLYCGSDNPAELGHFRSTRRFRENPLHRWQDVRTAVTELNPDVIHAHSTWAGVYTRVVPLGRPVIYQPHCYVFEDPERSAVARRVYRVAERLMGRRTAAVIAVSRHERLLSADLSPGIFTTFIPNRPTVAIAEELSSRSATGFGPVVTIGRIVPQKAPDFFAAVAKYARDKAPGLEFIWIGDGDTDARQGLEARGVRVTGWLDAEGVCKELDRSGAYLHTAAYEGFPLSVVNAAARRVPIVVRRIPAFDGSGLETFTEPEHAAALIFRLRTDPDYRSATVLRSEKLLTECDEAAVAIQFTQAYLNATTAARRRHDRRLTSPGVAAS